jgi:hypothetical protein
MANVMLKQKVEVQIGIGDTVYTIPSAHVRSVDIQQVFDEFDITSFSDEEPVFLRDKQRLEFSIHGNAAGGIWSALGDAKPKYTQDDSPCGSCASAPFTESAFRPGTCSNCGAPRGRK